MPNITRYAQVAFIALGLLPGCSWFRPAPPSALEQIENIDEWIAEGGYAAASGHEIDAIREVWLHDGQTIDVSVVAPKDGGRYPMIVYLPGLGEKADAGKLWRESWARAGYTVFCVQPSNVGEALSDLRSRMIESMKDAPPAGHDDDWMPEPPEDEDQDKPTRSGKTRLTRSGRNSELRYIGHEYFARPALESRIGHVLWAYEQFRQRAKAGQGLFAKADLLHLLVAGYDIGAQTAAALIGEKTGVDLPAQAQGFKPQAAIIISPSVDPASGNAASRYRDISVPLLAVTSEIDEDPYAISSPQVRTAFWEFASPGSKHLLLLSNAEHRLLTGSNWSQRSRADRADRGLGGDMFGFGGHSQGRRRAGAGMPEMGVGRMRYPDDRGGEGFRQIGAVFSVTAAFWDSFGKADNYAQLWLSQKADAWLDKSGRLKIK